MQEALTDRETEVLDLLAQVANGFCDIVGHGSTRHADLAEVFGRIHDLQARVLAQAGARAYPDKYRTLGSSGVKVCGGETEESS